LAAGAGAGLVTVGRFFSWLFTRYLDTTLAFLAGLMLGRLHKLRPWKRGVARMRDYDGDFVAGAYGDPIALVEAKFFPYLAVSGMTEEVVAAVRLAIANLRANPGNGEK
jgi:uncharacterized membrane protein